MNPFEMVVLIVAMVMIATVVKSRQPRRVASEDPQERAEALRLRDEVKQLKERIHVLERIATDRENTLARQIEELRDR
jgi:uncharacterized protein YlxW (UPF0749 family)